MAHNISKVATHFLKAKVKFGNSHGVNKSDFAEPKAFSATHLLRKAF